MASGGKFGHKERMIIKPRCPRLVVRIDADDARSKTTQGHFEGIAKIGEALLCGRSTTAIVCAKTVNFELTAVQNYLDRTART